MRYENTEMIVTLLVDREAAIRLGRSQHGTATGAIPPEALTEAQREELRKCDVDKPLNRHCLGPQSSIEYLELGTAGDTPAEFVDTVQVVLDKRIGLRAEQEQQAATEREEQIAAFLTLPVESEKWLISTNPDTRPELSIYPRGWSSLSLNDVIDDPRVAALIKKVDARIEQLLAAWRDKRDAKRTEKERLYAEEKVAKEANKARFAELMTSTILEAYDVERYTRGLMSTDEQLTIMRDWVFGPVWADRYTRLRGSDIDHAEGCYSEGERADWDTYDGDGANLTAEEFTTLKSIEKEVTTANTNLEEHDIEITVEPREHIGVCEECEERVRRGSVMLRAKVGPHKVSREFAL